MSLASDYIKNVKSGKEVAGEYMKLAIARHERDLDEAKDKGFHFEPKTGELAVERISNLFRHTKGPAAGKKFQMQPFQAFTLYQLFGWRKENGTRRFRKMYFEIARKNGKTEFAAAIANLMFLFDNEYGAEFYSAATKKDQAKIMWNASRVMMKLLQKDSAKVRGMVKIYRHYLAIPETESIFEALSSDSDSMDGTNPYYTNVDEYHAHKTSAVLEVMETGMGARIDPLLLITTTAGFNKEGPCYALRRTCIDILKGIKFDEGMLPLIWSMDEDDDWNDKTLWKKANPNLGVSVNEAYMDSQYTKAVNEGYTKQVQFKTKNLNIWTDSSATWIPDEVWTKNGGEVNGGDLLGKTCFGGLDLATTKDLTSLVLCFPPDESYSKYRFLAWHWCPRQNAEDRTKHDGVDYMRWASEGHLILTEGNVTDYSYIENQIMSLLEKYNIRMINYDRYNASQLVINLTHQGMKMLPFGQGFISMNRPTQELERLATDFQLNHGDNPILRWEVSNVELKIDPAGNVKVDKAKSSEKVDGVVAMVMALDGVLEVGVSKYEREGLRTL